MDCHTKLSNKSRSDYKYIPKREPNKPLPVKPSDDKYAESSVVIPIEADPDEHCAIPDDWKQKEDDINKNMFVELEDMLDDIVEPPPLKEADHDEYLQTPNDWGDDNVSKPYPRTQYIEHKKIFIQQSVNIISSIKRMPICQYNVKPLPPTPPNKIRNESGHHNNNIHHIFQQNHSQNKKIETNRNPTNDHNNYKSTKIRKQKTIQIGENEVNQRNMFQNNNINPSNCRNNIISMEGIPNNNKSVSKQIGQYPFNDTTSNDENDIICHQAFVAINKIRQNPKYLIPRLKEIKKNMKKNRGLNCWESEGRCYKDTDKEGPDLIDDTIDFLTKQESLKPLKANKELTKSAMSPIKLIVEDPSKLINNRHIPNLQNIKDSAKSDPDGRTMSGCGENIMYGISNGEDIICALIIDDGVKGRGHRKTIFAEKYTEIGFATALHKEKGRMCVSDFAAYFKKYTY